ncbi:MAG TPA: SH3 domain-containing protein [Thermoanaerobaculia bacterium]
MKYFAVFALLFIACKNDTPVVDTSTIDTRTPIGVRFVGAPELPVREKADDAAPVLATYQQGESLSVLTEKGEWVEVRTGERSGWVKAADLVTGEQRDQAEENPEPKFRKPPLPVTAPGIRGEVYIVAEVNTDGDVTSTKILENTTGSPDIAAKNEAVLRAAKFYPIVKNGQKRKFEYYHKVSY